jgi:hypothetical protein
MNNVDTIPNILVALVFAVIIGRVAYIMNKYQFGDELPEKPKGLFF